MPVLLLKSGEGPKREVPVGERVLVGRGAACGCRVDDHLVSREHAEVVRSGADYLLRDLGSRNGTRLNDEPVREARLAFGDEIGVGHSRLIFAEHAPSELLGTVVGGCEVLEQIGSGGMGVVYRARQRTLDRIVAIKVLHPRLVADATFVERFMREARAAGALNHNHLVHVHDAGRSGDLCFYIMEHVDGPTVGEELQAHGAMPPRRAVEIVLQIAAALATIHREGLIHRDIKPGNIMLAADGTAKLADLGLARPTRAQASDVERGADGRARVWGTPSYMAPEVALGQEADARSDLYSLGAMLFHMLTGRVPFLGATSAEVLTCHVRAPLPDLQALSPGVPTEVVAIVERLLAKRPERRYASAEELIADLAVAREVLRQAASADETRHVTPVRPAGAAAPEPLLRRLANWLQRSRS